MLSSTSTHLCDVTTSVEGSSQAIDQRNAALGTGINLGRALEAPNEGEWGVVLQAEYFDIVAAAGFRSVRVPIRWSNHAATQAPFTIDSSFFERIDWVLDQANRVRLQVIINIHHYDELHEDPDGHADRFVGLWKQIAERYANRPPTVHFELLNEPTGVFNEEPDRWNDLLARALTEVRIFNPDRPIHVGPVGNSSPGRLNDLILPPDPNLIVGLHYYEPIPFTHQGASWVDPVPPTGVTWSPNHLGIAQGWRDRSWSTRFENRQDSIGVVFEEQWAGFSVTPDQPLDLTSLVVEIRGAATLAVLCGVPGSQTRVAVIESTDGWREHRVDLSNCQQSSTRLSLQSTEPGSTSISIRKMEVCSNQGCQPVLAAAVDAIDRTFDAAARWGRDNNRPLHLGEFGSLDTGEMASRAAWTATVQRAARRAGMPSTYWQFLSGFGAYNENSGQWRQPLLDALDPTGGESGTVNNEDFTNGFGAWTSPGSLDPAPRGWVTTTGPTPTRSAGPAGGSNPSTKAVDGANAYAHVEASASDDPASMQSPVLDASSEQLELTFDYHARFGSVGGISDGILQVRGWNGSAWSNIGSSIVGSQQSSDTSPWLPSSNFGTFTSAGFSNSDFRFGFLFTEGPSSPGNYDASIDNIEIAPVVDGGTGSTGRARALQEGNRTLFVSLTGSDRNNGLSAGAPKRTINNAFNAAQPGDVVLIEDGDYFETISRSNSGGTVANPIMIAAINPGKVRVLNLRQDALQGTATWVNRGNGVFGLPAARERSYMAYEVKNGNFIPGYRQNSDINATSIDTNRGPNITDRTQRKPQYGMSFGSGEVRMKLKDGSNPTGQQIAMTDGFRQVQLTLNNCPNTIVDGLVFDGAGDGSAISLSDTSINCVIRNCQFFSCQFGVLAADNLLVEYCEYAHIGMSTFKRDLVALVGQSPTALFRWAKNHYVNSLPDTGGSNDADALVEGGIITNTFNGTPAQNVRLTRSYIHDCFDGSQLGRTRSFEFDNCYCVDLFDDAISADTTSAPRGGVFGESLIHDNRFRDCHVCVSITNDIIASNTRIYRNLMEVTDQDITRMAYPFKTVRAPNNVDVQIYHNTIKHISAEGQDTQGFRTHTMLFPFAASGVNGGRVIELFKNNLIIYESLDFGSNQPFTATIQDNVLANDDNASWRVNGGSFAGSEASLQVSSEFVPSAGSPLANAAGSLPAGLPDSRSEQTTVGCHEVGAVIDADWPRPPREDFLLTAPPRWTSPGVN